jgi:diguanylate cyclase
MHPAGHGGPGTDPSMRDPLTHAFNRTYFLELLDAEVAQAARSHLPLALLMIDLDHFRAVNDTFGHMPGDRALGFIVAQLARKLRAGEVLARYGGDELVVLLRAAKHLDATRLGDRLRRTIEALRFSVAGATVSLTVSVGVASLSEIARTEGSVGLLALADERLCAAKAAGRNRVCAA